MECCRGSWREGTGIRRGDSFGAENKNNFRKREFIVRFQKSITNMKEKIKSNRYGPLVELERQN